jgi:RNA ligase
MSHNFSQYPSLLSDRGIQSLRTVASADDQAIVTPKFHGSNFQVFYSRETGCLYGRRGAFLTPSEDHYGAVTTATALQIPGKVAQLFETLAAKHPSLQSIAVFGEVYGGWYKAEGVPFAKPARKPVQKDVWYSPNIELIFFDVRLDYASSFNALSDPSSIGQRNALSDPSSIAQRNAFMNYDDARLICESVGIPFVPAVFRGTVSDACAWAVETADSANALQFYNPHNYPLIPDNIGEGFVVRLAAETTGSDQQRPLAKIKSTRFKEVSQPKQQSSTHSYITMSRAASIASKLAESDIHMKNLKMLAESLVKDALADMDPTEAEVVSKEQMRQEAFVIMRNFIKGRYDLVKN